MAKKKKILWFAKGGGIAKCGPFKTQVEAVDAMRLVKYGARTRIAANFMKGGVTLALVQQEAQPEEFPLDVFVWPEET